MSTRATKEYLQTIRRRPDRDRETGAKCFSCLNLIDNQFVDEWHDICKGITPKTLPPSMIVHRAEFVRERIYPLHDQVLHDYRMHYKDGTYDCVSLSPVEGCPGAGKYCDRFPALTGGDFVTWEET